MASWWLTRRSWLMSVAPATLSIIGVGLPARTQAGGGAGGAGGTKDQTVPGAREKRPKLPQLGPEQTLRRLLTGYIKRDVDVVLEHMPPTFFKRPDRVSRFREAVKLLMTDQHHVVRIVDVRLEKISTKGRDRVALLIARLETSPEFSAVKGIEDNIRQYKWSLVQLNGKGHWYMFGGGF